MRPETFDWLLTPHGQTVLAEATRLYDDGVDPLRAGELLRRHAGAAEAAAAMGQAELRRRATAKMGEDAHRMYFTPDGLEQATRRRVAAHRAARVAASDPRTVTDLCCGIGGDLVALAAAGTAVTGVDLDPVRVAVARANLAALGLPGEVRRADATALPLDGLGDLDVLVADPSRRTSSGRVVDLAAYRPPWSFVLAVLERTSCVKVAPGIPHSAVPVGVEAEWVSEAGEVKEAALWSPGLASAARRASVIRGDSTETLTDADDPGPGPPRAVGRYLLEPDGAVIRAGLVTAVAAAVGGGLVDEHLAYVTADVLARTPFARCFEVLETLPFHERRLKAALRTRGVGRLTIKKRGVDVTPEALRRRLALRGDAEATLVLTRVAGKGTALLVEPV